MLTALLPSSQEAITFETDWNDDLSAEPEAKKQKTLGSASKQASSQQEDPDDIDEVYHLFLGTQDTCALH